MQPHLEDVADVDLRVGPQERGEHAEDGPQIQGFHENPPPMLGLDDPQALEHAECFPKRQPAGPDHLHQLPLGR